jgi:uncharacterized membrane protein
MDFRTSPAGRGLAWFQGAIRMLDKNPRGLLAVVLLLVLIQETPNLFGAIPVLCYALLGTSLVLGPSLFAGLLYAIGEADAGRPVASMQLFEGMRRPGVRSQLLLLGVLQALALLLILLAVQRIFGPDNIAILSKLAEQKLTPDSAEAQRMAGPLLQTMLVIALIVFILLAGMFFAIPRVLFDGRGAIAAFGESIVACFANVLSLTVYGLVLIAVTMVLGVVLAIIAGLLALLGKVGAFIFFGVVIAVTMVAMLVSMSGNYLAWRDVFGHADTIPQGGITV